MYPCDSGATYDNRFSPEINAADLNDLALDPRIESARKAVALLFETNSAYFVGSVAPSRPFVASSPEGRFYQLLKKNGPAGYDDRKSSIEIAVDKAIPLTEQLMFVVLPNEFIGDPVIHDVIINQWNCDPVGYSTYKGDDPATYYGVVRSEVEKRLRAATRI